MGFDTNQIIDTFRIVCECAMPFNAYVETVRLDHLYKMVALIYNDQNIARSPAATFGHFVEVCGMLTMHDRKKRREGEAHGHGCPL